MRMIPVVVVPELGTAAPGDAVAVSPWSGREAVATPGQLVCVRIDRDLLSSRSVAVVVEPMFGCQLYCHPRAERDGLVAELAAARAASAAAASVGCGLT